MRVQIVQDEVEQPIHRNPQPEGKRRAGDGVLLPHPHQAHREGGKADREQIVQLERAVLMPIGTMMRLVDAPQNPVEKEPVEHV